MRLIAFWHYDRVSVGDPVTVDFPGHDEPGTVALALPDEIRAAAERGEVKPSSRIEVTVTPDRRVHDRRSEDRERRLS